MVSQPRQSADSNPDQQVIEGLNATSGLYDPKALASSRSPTDEFNNFLEKNFRRKLTFDQMFLQWRFS